MGTRTRRTDRLSANNQQQNEEDEEENQTSNQLELETAEASSFVASWKGAATIEGPLPLASTCYMSGARCCHSRTVSYSMLTVPLLFFVSVRYTLLRPTKVDSNFQT